MIPAPDTPTQPCLVCGQPVPAGADLSICAAHFTEPPARARRSDPPRWWFRHRDGDWLLFQSSSGLSGGTPGQGWQGDWRIVNVRTREARQFIYTEETAVWLDALGVISALPRDYPDWWGRPLPTTPSGEPDLAALQAQMSPPRDASGRPIYPQLGELVRMTRAPVYGFVDSPLGLLLGSIHSSGSGEEHRITLLTFANSPQEDADPNRTAAHLVRVRGEYMRKRAESGRGASRWLGRASHPTKYPPLSTVAVQIGSFYGLTYDSLRSYPPFPADQDGDIMNFERKLSTGLDSRIREQLGDNHAFWLCREAHGLIWSGLPDLVDEVAASGAQLVQPALMVAGTEFRGDVLSWPGPIPLSVFWLEHAVAGPVVLCLHGASYGIPAADVVGLLEQLVVLNERPDVVAQYDAQLAEQLKRMREYYG